MTRAERTAFANVAGQQAWQAFQARLEAVETLAQAREASRALPAATEPGSAFYARLGEFLADFRIPPQTTPPERILYRGLLRRLEKAGDLETDRMWELLETLNHF